MFCDSALAPETKVAFYVKKTGPDQGRRGVVVFQTVVTQVGGFWNSVGNTYVIPERGWYVLHITAQQSGGAVHAGIMKEQEEVQRVR